jgi:transmembrane sensor
MRIEEEKLRRLITEQAAEWHVIHEDGALDSQQAQAFMRWLRTSPVHVAEYLTIAGLAKDVANAAHESNTPLDELLSRDGESVRVLRPGTPESVAVPAAQHSSPAPRRPSAHGNRAHYSRRRPFARWAVAFAMVVFASLAWLAVSHWPSQKPQTGAYATRHGEVRGLHLPDNTFVQLDSDSTIAIRFDGRSRQVDVERGQAYFKVAEDPARPFSVKVGASLIRDIGTAFDVYRDPVETTITVAQGHVEVANVSGGSEAGGGGAPWLEHEGATPSGERIAALGAGEQVRISSSGRVTFHDNVDVEQILAWRHGRIAFDGQPIASVVAEFNRYNDVHVSVVDPHIGALPITGTFDSHDLATFLAFLRSLPGVRLETHGQEVIVTASRGAIRHRR